MIFHFIGVATSRKNVSSFLMSTKEPITIIISCNGFPYVPRTVEAVRTNYCNAHIHIWRVLCNAQKRFSVCDTNIKWNICASLMRFKCIFHHWESKFSFNYIVRRAECALLCICNTRTTRQYILEWNTIAKTHEMVYGTFLECALFECDNLMASQTFWWFLTHRTCFIVFTTLP